MRTGIADLPLHGGKCPAWLFERMQRLGSAIIEVIVTEYGPREVLRRLADPFWFQALGCVLGFDWHSSGLTTTVCGALKEGLRGREKDLGVFIAGGKGKTSLRTPQEIEGQAQRYGITQGEQLIQASRLAAKVDNAALQDGYTLYHHVFVFTAQGEWAVVQQGMDPSTGWARRYHWLGEKLASFVCEPHSAVCGPASAGVLNLVAQEGEENRRVSVMLAGEKPERVLREYLSSLSDPRSVRMLRLPGAHPVPNARALERALRLAYQTGVSDYQALLGLRGVGGTTLRALALVAEVAYGAEPSFRDPVRYSFAHGGKDGHPYPVDRHTYDRSLAFLEEALKKARTGRSEKLAALKRLSSLKLPS
ncbi:MAG: DUF763 domain-containing protein [Moorellales bacterium]